MVCLIDGTNKLGGIFIPDLCAKIVGHPYVEVSYSYISYQA